MNIEHYERVLKERSPLRSVLMFLLRPAAFVRLAVEHDAAQSVVEAPDLRKAFLEGKYTPNVEYTRGLVEFRTKELRKSLFLSAIAVIGVGFLSAFVGFVLFKSIGICPPWLSAVLQMVGVGVILWATLWELG